MRVSDIQNQKLYFAAIGIDQMLLLVFICRDTNVHRPDAIAACNEQKLYAELDMQESIKIDITIPPRRFEVPASLQPRLPLPDEM